MASEVGASVRTSEAKKNIILSGRGRHISVIAIQLLQKDQIDTRSSSFMGLELFYNRIEEDRSMVVLWSTQSHAFDQLIKLRT